MGFAFPRARVSREEEAALIARWKEHRDERALRRLIIAHEPAMKQIAARYARGAVQFDDLMQECRVAFAQKLDDFDESRGVRLIKFVGMWMVARAQRFATRFTTVVSLPDHFHTTPLRARRVRRELVAEGIEPTTAAVAARLNISIERLEREERGVHAVSFDTPLRPDGDGGLTLGDTFADSAALPDEIAAEAIERDRVHDVIARAMDEAKLTQREQAALRLRFWGESGNDDGAVFEEVGRRLGVTRVGAQFVIGQALTKLRQHLQRRAPGLVPEADAPTVA